jgi:predicted DNA-binding WGR domain protein
MLYLDKNAVLLASEELMDKYGSTTTLDVKNLLRGRNYNATQSEVSNFMNELAVKENWKYSQRGNYRVYSFGQDTFETYQAYLEKDNRFCSIKAEDKKIIIEEGIIGKTGTFQEKSFNRNKKTIRDAKNWVEEKEKQGFIRTIDNRLPSDLRKKIGGFEDKKITKLIANFYNVKVEIKQKVNIENQNNTKQGFLYTEKQGGYLFVWENNLKDASLLTKTLNQILEISNFNFDYQKITGEKVVHKRVIDLQENIVQNYDKIIENNEIETKIWVSMNNLYLLELFFETGEKLNLSKFDYKNNEDFLKIIGSFDIK